MRNLLMAGVAASAAVTFAPLTPFAQTAQGDQCWTWRATTQDSNGQTLTCVHGLNTGHMMYWQYGEYSGMWDH